MKLQKNKIEIVPLSVMLLITIFSFLLNRESMPHAFRYINFGAALLIALYFMPYRLIKSMNADADSNSYYSVWNKIMLLMFTLGFAMTAVLQFANTEELILIFKVIKITIGVTYIVLLFMPKFEYKIEMFINLFVLVILMGGVTA